MGPTNMEVLDLRPIQRWERFGVIWGKLGQMDPGASLTIINDFEPLPLYGELTGRGYQYSTEKVSEGEWKVTIRRSS